MEDQVKYLTENGIPAAYESADAAISAAWFTIVFGSPELFCAQNVERSVQKASEVVDEVHTFEIICALF